MPVVKGSSSASQEDLASSSLPEGAGLMTDEHGKQFVTVPQANGQVYAYPLEEYNKNPQAVMTGQAQASGAPVQAEPITTTPPPKRDLKVYKPIRVDNWGIFVLSRLQSFFTKKEYCDLTLRFPARNAQIKVHRLVVHSCTDFFFKLEQRGGQAAAIEMPPHMLPEHVAPIIKFMYTGQ